MINCREHSTEFEWGDKFRKETKSLPHLKKLAFDGRHKGSECITNQSLLKARKFFPSRGLSMCHTYWRLLVPPIVWRGLFFSLVLKISIFSFVSSAPLCWYWQDVPFHRLVELRQIYSNVNHLMNRVQNEWRMMIIRNGQNFEWEMISLAENIFDISQPTIGNWNPPHPPNVFMTPKTTLAPFFCLQQPLIAMMRTRSLYRVIR